MTSLNRKDNTEAIVEDDPDDPIDEESEEVAGDDPGDEEIAEITGNDPGNEEISVTTGHELDEPGDEKSAEVTGHELDEPEDEEIEEVTGDMTDDPEDEEIAEVTGDMTDDPGDEESAEVSGDVPDDPEDEESAEIFGNEPNNPGDEQSEKITGDDLDEPGSPEGKSIAGNDLNESKDKESKTYKEKKIKFKGIKKEFRVKRTWFLVLVTGICLLAGGGYYFFQHNNGKEINSRSNIFPIPHDKSIVFESFIVPIHKKQGYTYISLNLLLELSNIKLKVEIVEKKDQLRGIFYDILEQEIHRIEDADALDKLKTLIIRRANTVLISGEVREAFITNFLLV